jgi:hypothetical protein
MELVYYFSYYIFINLYFVFENCPDEIKVACLKFLVYPWPRSDLDNFWCWANGMIDVY